MCLATTPNLPFKAKVCVSNPFDIFPELMMPRSLRKLRDVGLCPRQYKCDYILGTVFCKTKINIRFIGTPTGGLWILHGVITLNGR